MKRSMQRAASRDRKRHMQNESIPNKTQNYPAIHPSNPKATIDDCLAELESSISASAPDSNIQQSSSPTNTAAAPTCTLHATRIRDKIELWNQSITPWSTRRTDNGKPPPAMLLPSFDLEMTRHFKLQELSTFFLEATLVMATDGGTTTNAPKRLKMPSFERWLLDAKLQHDTTAKDTGATYDPILPKHASVEMAASQRLVEELVAAGIHKDHSDAKKLVKNLCLRSNQAYAFLQKQAHMTRLYLWKKGDQIDVEFPEHDDQQQHSLVTLVYRRPKQWKKPFCIKVNQSHYDKLKTLFYQTHSLTESSRVDRVFHLLLMLLLLRYSSLSGGHLLKELRGGGMQGAIHESVFDVLTAVSHQTLVMEGFASPFNCFLSAFGSAFFHDLDWHFGSVGNFLHLPFAQEAANHDSLIVQANPPFSPGIMKSMSNHILQQVTLANESEASLTFIVIVPSPGDPNDPNRAVAKRCGGEAIQALLDTEMGSHHIILDAKEHGYIEGAQHLRPTRYKESLYDTSVIVVSSNCAAKKLEIGSLEERLRNAFQSKHRAETDARRSVEEDADLDDVSAE